MYLTNIFLLNLDLASFSSLHFLTFLLLCRKRYSNIANLEQNILLQARKILEVYPFHSLLNPFFSSYNIESKLQSTRQCNTVGVKKNKENLYKIMKKLNAVGFYITVNWGVHF